MVETNQEGYQTLGWIINESEYGFYLVVAQEAVQEEIADVYRLGAVEIYDCKKYPGEYSFQKLREKLETFQDKKTIFIQNFHMAVQDSEDLKRLNFSRDMLAGMKKNLVFFTTLHGDDMLAKEAYDFYSFIKIRIVFPRYEKEEEETDVIWEKEISDNEKKSWSAEELKEKMEQSYSLISRAKALYKVAEYRKSEKLLLAAKEIREDILGKNHLEVAEIYSEFVHVYLQLGQYRRAEKLGKQLLAVREEFLGEEHTATCYEALANLYIMQGKYDEVERLQRKALGREHKSTKNALSGLIYVRQKLKEKMNK